MGWHREAGKAVKQESLGRSEDLRKGGVRSMPGPLGPGATRGSLVVRVLA